MIQNNSVQVSFIHIMPNHNNPLKSLYTVKLRPDNGEKVPTIIIIKYVIFMLSQAAEFTFIQHLLRLLLSLSFAIAF